MDDRPAQPGQLTGEKGVNDYRNGDNLGLEPTTPSPEPPAAPKAEPSDEEIDAIAASMPDGAGGMLKQWGYRQFARALLARYGAQPAARVEPVAAVVREHDGRAFAVLRDAGADLPDGTELYAAIDTAQAQPKRRPYNASASLSEYGIFPECDAAPAAQTPRACTCHPDDRPDGPCRERYAASECQALAAQAPAANADALLDALRQIAEWPDGGNLYGQGKIKRFAQHAIDAAMRKESRQ
jgi:hypothetical protein